MTQGPLEYTVIGFEGNRFNGEIANEIERAVENGSVRLVDILLHTQGILSDEEFAPAKAKALGI